MRARLLRIAIWLGALAMMLLPVAVRAADMPGTYLPPPKLEKDVLLEKVQYWSGWYIRGDFGYRFNHVGSATSSDTTLVPQPSSGKIDNSFVGGLGVGYKIGWFRMDVTGDYSNRTKYTATTATGSTFDGKIDDFTVLFNGYADLGTWSGFTPYIGAGVGGANVIFSSYQNPTGPAPPTNATTQRWNVAWAVMAGVSYSITYDLLMDVGYRHIELGDVVGGPASALTIKNLSGDEIRVGFRYLLN